MFGLNGVIISELAQSTSSVSFLKPAETKLATKRHKINAFGQIWQVYILQLD